MRKKVEQLEDLHSVHHVSSCMLSVAWKDPRVHLMPSFHYLQILNCLLIQRSTFFFFAFSSAQFSHSVMSDSLRPHESQHVRPPCPLPTPSEWTGWISLQSKGLSRVFSNTTAQKHQFFSAQPSSQSNSHIHTGLLEKQ